MTQEQQDKQAFFAAYPESNYYREIKQYTGESDIVGPWKAIERFVSIEDMDSFHKKGFKNVVSVNDYLELTPLSAITDEDALEAARILDINHSGAVEDVKEWLNDRHGFSRIKHKWECLEIFDHLRSRGYLLPFRQFSTQQLLDMGWAKIKEG